MFTQQKPSSEAIESSIIDLHDKEQLMANKIKEDQKDALIKVCNDSMHICTYCFS